MTTRAYTEDEIETIRSILQKSEKTEDQIKVNNSLKLATI